MFAGPILLSPPSPTFSEDSDMLLETASEMSSTLGVGGPFSEAGAITNGVGLSNPQYSRGRRKFLDLVNRLHSTGVQLDIDLPMIAVIGSQSAGKSSLIEAISGVSLPRAGGTCTRCPTECHLTYSDTEWKCSVSLRFVIDEHGETLGQVRNVPFGGPIFVKDEVEERVRRAQRAILSPSTSYNHFLDGSNEDLVERQFTFSPNCICLHITGRDVADLSFCDLPGLIASVGTGGDGASIELIRNLVISYIGKPSCIILLTVACETDFMNQGAHELARLHDPDGKRTIGVLTKPDRISLGEERQWLNFILNTAEPLENGWYSVKQPDSQAISMGMSWDLARAKEREFFSSMPPWSGLNYIQQRHLGTLNLTSQLSTVLSDLISRRLPELQDELQKSIQLTEDSLRDLPQAPSSDALSEILNMLDKFCQDLGTHLKGTPTADGLLQQIRPTHIQFRKDICGTTPDFRPYSAPHSKRIVAPDQGLSDVESDHGIESSATRTRPPPPEISIIEDNHILSDNTNAIYLEQVLEHADSAVTRELPGYHPFAVPRKFIDDVVAKWDIPTMNLFRKVQSILITYIRRIVQDHFTQYPLLHDRVMSIMTDFVRGRCQISSEKIMWLLDLEKQPATIDKQYYLDYRDKFLVHYKASRQQNDKARLMAKLQSYNDIGHKPGEPDNSFDSVTRVLSGLNELGIHGAKPTDISKMIPSDPYDAAIDIMASVRAYLQIAYKRYTDIVPMAIDHDLILGLNRDGILGRALRKELGVTGPEGFKYCQEYLKEPEDILAQREELRKKKERLEKAMKELTDLWL